MAEFYIKPPKTFSYSYKLKECANRLDHYARETGNIRNDLNNAFSGSGSVSSELKELIEQFGKEKGFALLLKKGIEEIVLQYFKSESSIMDILLPNKGAYHVDSIVFDDVGGYGGNQGHMEQVYYWDPFKCWGLLDDLRKYYPHMSIFEAFDYFSHLNSVGCGYVALANTIFMEYADRPEEFERIFGYPMYKDGDLNFDRLILDIYATTDLAGINDDDGDGRPDGTLDYDRARIMENFLRDKGVEVRTEANANVTRENFRKI